MMKTHTKKQRELRNTLIGWLLVMPSLIFMAAFTVWPVFRSIWLSLTKYKLGMSAPEFIGLKNYINLAGSSLFWKVMGNTLFFALITIVPSMVVGLFLATLVNRKSRLIGFVRTSYFYPVVMPMIAIASIWMFIYMAKNGLLDQMLISMGFQPMNILSSKKTVLPAMAFMYVWKEAGYLMVFFLSGIQSISTDVNEAARIDGANSWTIFRKITLPLLAPTFLFVSTIALTNSFKLVDHVVIMTEGAPNNASTLLLYYIYQQGFTNFNYGVSSTLTTVMLLLLMVVALPRFLSQDKKIQYNYRRPYTMQKKHLIGAGITAFSVILGLLWLIPLIWLIGTAFSVPSFHMTLFPTTAFTLDNIKYVWNAIPFGTYYINTLTLVVCTFAVQFFTSTLAAYALAVLDFKGQALVFAVIFMQIIIPNDVLITPNFMTLSDLKLIDSKIGMMLPFYGSAMAIFLLRQHFKSMPKALAEAAKIDGANTWQTIWGVYMPCAKPAYLSFAVISVSYHWNNYLWPLIVTNSPTNRTLTVGLAIFAKSKEANMQWANVCAAAFIIIVPLLLAFLVAQKQFMSSFVSAGIKE